MTKDIGIKLACFIGGGAILLVGFQNCSKASFVKSDGYDKFDVSSDDDSDGLVDESGNPVNPGDPIDIDIVKKACDTLAPTEQTISISFNNPGVVCDWGINGNLDIRNGYFQARTRQTQSLGLPVDAIICDAQFDFQEQEFWYDDVFVLSLNDNVLVSSYKFDAYLNESNGFYLFNWDNIVGKLWDADNKSEDYCVGSDAGLSTCSFPAQHDEEPIMLSMEPIVIQNAMANSGIQEHKMHLTTLGDNDASDCQHFNMEFAVKVTYVR